MGYELLADSREELEKLAKCLRLRIERKEGEMAALEEGLKSVEAKLKKLSEAKP